MRVCMCIAAYSKVKLTGRFSARIMCAYTHIPPRVYGLYIYICMRIYGKKASGKRGRRRDMAFAGAIHRWNYNEFQILAHAENPERAGRELARAPVTFHPSNICARDTRTDCHPTRYSLSLSSYAFYIYGYVCECELCVGGPVLIGPADGIYARRCAKPD